MLGWMLAGLLLLLAAFCMFFLWPNRRRNSDEFSHASVSLREERLELKKTKEQLADVTTHKEIVQETRTVTVPVQKEELVVEKNGVEAARIPIREQRVEVVTRSVPLNEVSVHRRQWEENKEIQAVLKKEVARIETTGDAQYSEEGPGH